MGNREKLRIELAERSYDIWIGANLIQDSAEIILSLIRSNHIIIVTDKNIANYCYDVNGCKWHRLEADQPQNYNGANC